MRYQIKLVAFLLALPLSLLSHASSQSVRQLAEQALAATVSLEVKDGNGVSLRQGSGFFVRANLIATNFHVIDGATKVIARLANKESAYPIEGLTAADKINDLALLKVTIHGVTPLLLGDSTRVQIGQTVYVAGNHLGFDGTFSTGVISGRRNADGKERLQMSAPISPGSSGGPVLNRKGEVIGVCASAFNPISRQYHSFAIPSNVLNTFLTQSERAEPLLRRKDLTPAVKSDHRGDETSGFGDRNRTSQGSTRSVHNNPNEALTYVNRGDAKLKSRQNSAAIADFDATLRLSPDSAAAYHKRGMARAELGQYTAAVSDFDAALRLNPDYVAAYYNRGVTKAELGQYTAAVSDFDAALRLNPDYVAAHYNRGVVNLQLDRYSAALADFDTAIRLNPKLSDAYYNRGTVNGHLGLYSAALSDFDTVLRLDPNNADTYFMRGIFKRQMVGTRLQSPILTLQFA